MNRLPANQKHQPLGKRWKRYEQAQPGHRLQLDVKFLERIAGTRRRLYQFTAIDDCTRIRVLKLYHACNQRTAIQFIDEVLRLMPFRVHVVQTDDGAEFQSHSTGISRRATFATSTSAHVRHGSMGKWSARTASMTRSSINLLDKDGISDDIHLFNERLREWEDYKYHRPHGALAGQTLYKRLLAKTRAEALPKS